MKKISEFNKEKDSIQNQAIELFKLNNILLSWATGCGKSLAAIKCIEEDILATNSKWYIVCWETTHIDNWLKEFKQYKKEHLLKNIEIFCYASLHKYKEKRNLVLDEVHHITDLSAKYIKEISPKRMIALSATVPDDKKMLLYQIIPFKEFKINLDDAISKGIIPVPKVYIVDHHLNDTIKSEFFIMEKGNKLKRTTATCSYESRYSTIKNFTDVSLKVTCTQKEKYNFLTEQVEYLKRQHFQLRQEWTKFKWLKAGNDRKKFIAECKTTKAKELLEIVEGKRFVCFTGSTEQCKSLGGKSVVSSATNATNDSRIQRFNSGKTKKLFAIKMLREGVNLYNIEAGIIVQLDNQPKSFIQILGRVLRSKYPVMFIIILRDTQDETYMNTCLEGFNSNYLLKYESEKRKDIFSE